jgi:hypothetical protein
MNTPAEHDTMVREIEQLRAQVGRYRTALATAEQRLSLCLAQSDTGAAA